MRYVIMANGKGHRWNNFQGVPKMLAVVDGETLLARTTRIFSSVDPNCEVVISSSDERCEAPGAVRHVPERGAREIDRFCYELIDDDVCFLYGDTFYTEQTARLIASTMGSGMLFFGTPKSIVAVKVFDAEAARASIDALVSQIEAGEIQDAKGWGLYHSYQGMPLDGREIGAGFVVVEDGTTDFNTSAEYLAFLSASKPADAASAGDDASQVL